MSDLSGLYQDLILDHSRRRVGEGPLPDADAERFVRNPSCGDEVTARVRLDRSSAEPRIAEIAWEGDGCSISIAGASMLAEQFVGGTVAQAREAIDLVRTMLRSRGRVNYEDGSPEAERIGDAIALAGTAKYVMRVKCAMLAFVALEQALDEAAPPAGTG